MEEEREKTDVDISLSPSSWSSFEHFLAIYSSHFSSYGDNLHNVVEICFEAIACFFSRTAVFFSEFQMY
jgi:hypothetical protein